VKLPLFSTIPLPSLHQKPGQLVPARAEFSSPTQPSSKHTFTRCRLHMEVAMTACAREFRVPYSCTADGLESILHPGRVSVPMANAHPKAHYMYPHCARRLSALDCTSTNPDPVCGQSQRGEYLRHEDLVATLVSKPHIDRRGLLLGMGSPWSCVSWGLS